MKTAMRSACRLFVGCVVVFLTLAAITPTNVRAQISTRHDGAGGGAVVVGTSTTTCDSTLKGGLRYDTTGNVLQLCDGTNWVSMGGAPTFTFTDTGGAPTSTLTYSNTITITGFAGSQAISISGSGTPQFSINGAAFTGTSTTISAGQTLQVRLTSAATGATAYSATVTIGSATDVWTVTTASRIVIFENGVNVNGGFGAAGGGGRAGADAYCNSRKPSAMTCNAAIRALVSLDASDEIRDMPTNYSIPTGVPVYWYNRTSDTANVQVGTNWADILDSSIANTYQAGTGTAANSWTGSTTAGAIQTHMCNGWTDTTASYSGHYGLYNVTDGQWLAYSTQTCNAATLRVSCLCVQN